MADNDSNYLVAYENEKASYKLCRIIFDQKGSYYVTTPYYPTKEAQLFKTTVNYARGEQIIPFSQIIDNSALDDEGHLKLSHHPDGFMQFSGKGILSGRDESGIKGMGIMTWPLERPVKGPAFGLTMIGIERFARAEELKGRVCKFTHRKVFKTTGPIKYILEGYYLPPLMRRFVRLSHSGEPVITTIHPSGVALSLKVLFPSTSSKLQGFIGIEFYTMPHDLEDEEGFTISGSTGNIRYNKEGEMLGDGIYCAFPRFLNSERRLEWPTVAQHQAPAEDQDS